MGTERNGALQGQRVGVIGGGIGGMAVAIRAAAEGAKVTLVEADPDWRVAGAGITITGPTYRALRRLGVLDRVLAEGFFIDEGPVLCASDGTRVGEVPMRPIEPGLPTSGGIMRPRLHAVLAERVRAAGVEVRLGVTARAIETMGGTVSVDLGEAGPATFDVLVGADGAFSETRRMLFPDAPAPHYTGQYCWRMVAPRPADVDRPVFFIGDDVTAGLMPCSDDRMYMWLLETAPERRRVEGGEARARLKAMLAPFGGRLGELARLVDAADDVNARPLDALILPRPWHVGRTILIGDAAHATTPHLASGAGVAIEDALVLVEALAATASVPEAFERFEARRWERCRLVVESSVAIGRMQQQAASPDKLNELMRTAQQALAADI